ncbi:antibiotic biosynthesis monooxygenase family protein [Actinomycetospora sp.]|jgi:heme-degrading monooxygenase HmoA|uniref:antibiotic biosynthesis monooxygenase family protein n=1 Tax=Actinomycetospora sp. TaxID=1872135 RepID=UPI002F3EA48B
MSVTFVNCFEIPAGREDDFFARWRGVNAVMRTRPGYEEHQLYRSLAPEARFRFVNVARWSSSAALATAHDDEFRAMVSGPDWAEIVSTPAVYEEVHTGTA